MYSTLGMSDMMHGKGALIIFIPINDFWNFSDLQTKSHAPSSCQVASNVLETGKPLWNPV